MKRKLFVVGVGVSIGYLLGSHAGRERYDWMKAQAIRLWENPRVTKTRLDVEAYARQQAPIIRERAEAAAKAAPGIAHDVTVKVSDAAKDVADKTASTARDVADKTAAAAKDVTDKTVSTAKTIADKTARTAKDVADKTATVAVDVADKTVTTARDVAEKANDVAADIKDRGETVVDNAVANAGEARDKALDVIDDEDESKN
jgi:hypothetical protein